MVHSDLFVENTILSPRNNKILITSVLYPEKNTMSAGINSFSK